MDYKNAGVDIEAGYKSVELMKQYVQGTMRPEVLGGIGGFSGAFSAAALKNMEEPTLLSGTDGVGTKLKLAFLMDKHDTVGIDCVAMCVNDVACAGGEPLFFLDYIACGKNVPEKIAAIVKGVAEGCRQAGAALVGGETAEMPGFYPEDEYDLAGFAVGAVDKKDLITGDELREGDVLIGMASSGVHSNGFSLVRKVFEQEMTKEGMNTYYDELGTTLGEALLTPTKIYVKALKSLREAGVRVKACSHITGGGFYENVPRMLKEGVRAVIKKDSYPVPPIFHLLAKKGQIEEKMMYNTYNMGLGMILAVKPEEAERAMEAIKAAGEAPYVVGSIEKGQFNQALLETVDRYELDLIVLAGFLVKVPEIMIEKYRNRIINIHPSLIPSFCGVGYYGLKVHEAALKRGVKLTGATVHFVDEGMDSGPILLQKAVEVLPGDTPESLQKRVMEQAEWQLLPQAIDMIANGRIS